MCLLAVPLAIIFAVSLASATQCAPAVDASTMDGKIICGYQGWFGCPGDGNDPGVGWRHWSKLHTHMGAIFYNTDVWPDTSEYDQSDLFLVPDTTLKSGAKAYLFSSSRYGAVDVHFRWMQEYGIDGVFLERFTQGNELDKNGPFLKFKNTSLANVQVAARANGRVWAVEYDITGDRDTETIYDRLSGDWQFLKKTYGLYSDPSYLHHDGKPIVVIFGLGFKPDHYAVTPPLAHKIIEYFKTDGCYVIAGVPWGWRTLTGGSKTDPEWASVYRSLDGIKPWTVGAYRDWNGILKYKEAVWGPDIEECNRLGISYLPTAWPRFGWDNMHNYECGKSKVSSRGGQHFWDQIYAMKKAGARTIYGAMFDEYDESTAMMKATDDVPDQGCFWTNEGMPKDWHLRLLNCAGQTLRGKMPVSQTIPISSTAPADNAEIVRHKIPSNMVAGEQYQVSVTVKNTGETCWNARTFKLAVIGDAKEYSLPLGSTVPPGKSHTFNFTLTSPNQTGDHTLEWQMVHKRVGQFGPLVSKQVRVTGPKQ